jgi:predicted metal-dependent hydrolase
MEYDEHGSAGIDGERGSVQFGNTVIEFTVTRSARRKKTIEITLDHAEGVLVAAPLATPPERIRQVVLKRAAWIVRQSSEEILHPRRKEFVSGESLLYLGREARLTVVHADVRRVSVEFEHWEFRIVVPAQLNGEERRAAVGSAVVNWYRARAGERLAERAEIWAKKADLTPAGVLVRDQRQRWGSCSPDGVLRFNWRIVMAPPAVIDYVVVHELVHLRSRTHSDAFWLEVARLMPDYGIRRSLLKEIGQRLTT